MFLSIELISTRGFELFGTASPTESEVSTAAALMDDAPKTGTPLDVARYFESLSALNSDGESYIAEWRHRSNPLIVAFFSATSYDVREATDQTRWCAAFVNWCLQRVAAPSTESASSGSFRCFGTEASPPQAGDIVVFAAGGDDKACEGSGHVGFYLSATSNHVEVLGGNQSSRIKATSFQKLGRNLSVKTIRRLTD